MLRLDRIATWLACLALLAGMGLLSPPQAVAKILPVVKPVMACAALAETDVTPEHEPPARILSARVVTAGTVGPYCEVRGYVAPQVNFELRLPTQNWMQRLMFSGCGGFCGRVDFRVRAAEGCVAVDNGEFAMVASDLGHSTPDGNGDTVWAANSPQARADYGYRGVHVVTAAAKTIVARFYGRPQAYAYFNGCSDGGREGLMEVQRYPSDFNGVIAGASVINDTANNSISHAWEAQHLQHRDGSPMFKPEDFSVLHAAALEACDTAGDGVRDGVIGDPLACRFDPTVVQCRDAQSRNCLTPDQVAAAKALYSGPLDPSGKPIYYGRPVGSELHWGGADVGAYAQSFIRYMTTPEPRPFDLWSVAYDPQTVALYDSQAATFNAMDPDIRRFQQAGGKLILWHGWSDPGVPPMSSVDYYAAVARAVGSSTDSFIRLYMLPGVGHCGGGDGPDKLNLVDPIVAWVEDGVAPGAVEVALKTYGRTTQTRPVFPFPATARFKGAGDPMKASAFVMSRP